MTIGNRAPVGAVIASLLGVLVGAGPVRASEITSVSPPEITLGGVVTITGSGFLDPTLVGGSGRARMPRVFGLREGSKKRIRFRVLAATETEVTTRVRRIPRTWKRQAAGTSWTIHVVPRGRRAGGASFHGQPITVVGPVLIGVTPGLAGGGDEIALEVAHAGTGRMTARIGGRRVKIVQADLPATGNDSTMFFARVPRAMPDGRWDVAVRNRVGGHALTGALAVVDVPAAAVWLVLNGKTFPGDDGAGLQITAEPGGLRLEASDLWEWVNGPFWAYSRDDYVLWIPFDPQIHVPPVTFTGPPADAASLEMTSWSWDVNHPHPVPIWFTGKDLRITIDSCAGGRVLGHFEGTLSGVVDLPVEGLFATPLPGC